MKKFYLLLICVLAAGAAFCSPFYIYTATKSGPWNDMSGWTVTVRTDGQLKNKVIIPSPYVVIADNNVNSFGLGDVEIQISGKLNVHPNTTINLSAASSIELLAGGQINGSNNTEIIKVGAVTKYDGSKDLTKSGASIADASTGISPLGFTPTSLLAVKLISFSAEKSATGVLLKWTTATETSNDYFGVERSFDGNTWNTIATIKGNGTTQNVSSYQYADNNAISAIVYYRLKQVDADGQGEFSAVRIINGNGSSANASKMYAFNKNIFIEPARDITTDLNVVIMTVGGQLIMKQQYSASGKISINLSNLNTNVVLVNISNGRGLNQSSKLLL
jgi:hypothetical protein